MDPSWVMWVFLQESESDSAWMTWPEAPMLPEASPLGGLACPLGPGAWESQLLGGRLEAANERMDLQKDLPKIWRYLKYGVKHRWNGKLWNTIKHVIYIYSSFWDVFFRSTPMLERSCVVFRSPTLTTPQCNGSNISPKGWDGWMPRGLLDDWRQCQALAIPRPSQRLPTSSEL